MRRKCTFPETVWVSDDEYFKNEEIAYMMG